MYIKDKFKTNFKKTLLIDLDGVLNQYTGKYDENFIPDPMKKTENFLKELSQDFVIKIFTTRNKELANNWLIEHSLDKYVACVTNTKDLAWLMIDDRCEKFDGDYEHLIKQIRNFKPWYK